ncbi:MAG: hypothetical protein KBD27_00035 [Candidatus Moranbacteria bacterium]|nr:hypothetical protein [Candidatus Moranbacteria bacterium]
MFFLAFIFGLLSAVLALVLEIIFIAPTSFPELTALSWSFKSILILATIALIEEVSKYLLLTQYLLRFATESLIRIPQKILFGCLFGLGFGAVELTLAYYSTPLPGMGSGFFGIAMLHIITSLILLFLFFQFADTRKRLLIPLAGAILVHLLYNVLLSFFLA